MIRSPSLTILGSGTSAGVPLIGCSCHVCRSPDPRNARLRTSGLLRFVDAQGQERAILIDASPDLRQQALRAGLERCDAILFTHSHVDHIFGLDDVRRFNAVMGSAIDIYADRATMESLRRVYSHIFEREKNVNDSFVASLVPHVIDPLRPFELFGVRITPVPLLHGNLPVLGYRFDSVGEASRTEAGEAPAGEVRHAAPDKAAVASRAGALDACSQPSPLPAAWCTDVSAIPPEAWPHLSGLRTLVLDMLRYRRHPTHFTVDEAVNVAGSLGAGSTWFVHMTHDIEHGDLDARLPEGMRLAWDGLVIT